MDIKPGISWGIKFGIIMCGGGNPPVPGCGMFIVVDRGKLVREWAPLK